MSKNKKMVEDLIQEIETSIIEGLKRDDFVISFRKKIDKYLAEKLK